LGGVSHNMSKGYSPKEIAFYKDIDSIFLYEVEPYKKNMSEEAYDKAKNWHQVRKAMYECARDYEYRNNSFSQYRENAVSNLQINMGLVHTKKYILVAVDDAATLSKSYGQLLRADGDAYIFVIAFCDPKYEKYWSERLIGETNKYRADHDNVVTVQFEYNYLKKAYKTFLFDLATKIGEECIVIASVGKFKRDAFGEPNQKSINDQIDIALRQLSEIKTSKDKSPFFKKTVNSVNKGYRMLAYGMISSLAFISALFIDWDRSINNNSNIVYNWLSATMFAVSVIALLAYVLCIIDHVINELNYLYGFKNNKVIRYGERVGINFFIGLLAVYLMMKVCLGFFSGYYLSYISNEAILFIKHIHSFVANISLALAVLNISIQILRVSRKVLKWVKFKHDRQTT